MANTTVQLPRVKMANTLVQLPHVNMACPHTEIGARKYDGATLKADDE